MARTTDYKLKGEKIKGQIDELVTALLEERKIPLTRTIRK